VERNCCFLVYLLMMLFSCGAFAAPISDVFGALSEPTAALDANTPIEVDAKTLDYDKHNGRITADGNVVITCGLDVLHADRVLVNMNSGDAYALGHVVLRRGDKETRSTKLQYNFRTRLCNLDDPEIDAAPFKVLAEKVERVANNEYVLHEANVTTCRLPYPHSHYHIRARRITVVPGEYMRTNGAVWYFGRVPCLYMPYWRHSLDGESGFKFYPGYGSRWGAYLLSSYYHPVSSFLRAEHHVDYRDRRGVALGEDLKWNTDAISGMFSVYLLDDQAPVDDDEDAATSNIDSERYRIHLRHNQSFDQRTQLLSQLNYLSDTDVCEDFFRREYRTLRQPENYISLSHRRDGFTVTADLNARLNDFYSNVNRLPEVSVDFVRLQLGNSSFYYEGQTAAARLERVWSEDSGNADYDTIRFDTEHMIYQPRRYFGWLNFVPRLGYRGTYYTDTKKTVTSPSISTTTTTNTTVVSGIPNTVVSSTTSTSMVTSVVGSGADIRNLLEVGAEISFKAFKVWKQSETGADRRHVLEPYANYTLRLAPSVGPEDLYQFDTVDALGELHQVRVGARNKIQAKRNGRPFDLIDLDTYTILNLDLEGNERVMENIYADVEFRPTDWLAIDMDSVYDVEESTLDQINSRFTLTREDEWEAAVEHRYRRDVSDLLSGTLTLHPSTRWAFNVFGRYEFETARVQEAGGYVERKLDCLGVRLGGSAFPGFTRSNGTEQNDEYRVMLEFWLTAFPEVGLHVKERH